jgi:acetyl esterase
LDFTYATPSHVGNGQGFMLTAESLAWFRGHYLADAAAWSDPRASPGLAAVDGELPPAYILVAGCDPLRDEALDYARRLRAADVPVVERYATGQIHGFAMMTRIMTESHPAIGDAAAWLRECPAARITGDKAGQVSGKQR